MPPTLPIRIGPQLLLLALLTTSSDSFAFKQTAYEFDILRDGAPVGHHDLRVSHSENETRVLASSWIEVTFLGFTVYRMRYNAEEVWDLEGIRSMAVSVDDDGKSYRIDGQRRGGRFHWKTSEGDENALPLPVFPTNHWNPAVVDAPVVLNTLTGESNQVEVSADSSAAVSPLPNKSRDAATAYQYSGDLNLTSWYDPQGRWIGMRFKGRDGSDIEYVCRNCGDGLAL